jgi:hypothetical protein
MSRKRKRALSSRRCNSLTHTDVSLQIDDLAAATFTPYNADGSVNYAGVDAHAADLAKHGVPYAFSE